ncbi:MAG: methionine synthase [PVC group bacterium]|nr:methionine synthase [PVC group bacterium]
MKVNIFEQINVTVPQERIYSRLGYAKGKTQVSKEQIEQTEQYIDQALSVITLKGAAVRIDITDFSDALVSLTNGSVLASRDLAEFLSGSKEVLFMGATSGLEIMRLITENAEGKDVTAAVVFDAVASEMTDAALGWMMNYFNNELRRENKVLTKRRFSAGYGDFGLENQKLICDLLEMEKLGVKVSETSILIPEKSVTAVAGIK